MTAPALSRATDLAVPTGERWLIRLRLEEPVRFHFLHGGVLHGLLCAALGHELPKGLVLHAPESGRVHFGEGDAYHFGVSAFGEAHKAVRALEAGLRKIGGRRHRHGCTLEGNFAVESVTTLGPPDRQAIEAEALQIAELGEVTLRFLSPLRLPRPAELRQQGAGYLNQDCFPAEYFLDRLYRWWIFLLCGSYPKGEDVPTPPAAVSAGERSLHWLDLPVDGPRRGKPGRPNGMTLGGVLGEVELSGITPPWATLLAVGRHLHAGQGTRYGFGRYWFPGLTSLAEEPFLPATTHLERLCRPGTLEAALDHVTANSQAAGVDGIPPETFTLRGEEELARLRRELGDRTYQPQPLLGFLHPKKDGGWRPLAVPTVADRVAQRAAGQLLAPAVDTLLEDCSFAYRKGLSRAGAARAIQQAYEAGYRYVLEADIEAFFDSVDWQRLLGKLTALFPTEPLVRVIDAWVRAPVEFRGQTVRRRQGLPQGSPIAPLLANLFLDEFDEEILGQDYRLVRYADDFVILTKDAEQARRAHEATRRALEDLGLTLNEEKTGIRSLDQGFTYLGYLFCRSMALDQEEGNEALPETLTLEEKIPTSSWLSAISLHTLRQLEPEPEGQGRKVKVVPLADSFARRQARIPLYLVSHESSLRLDGEAVVLEGRGGHRRDFPIRSLSHLVFLGRNRATVPALLQLARHGVPSYFCSWMGELQASFAEPAPRWQLWQEQARAAEDPEQRVAFAREVVAAKIHNATRLVVRFGLGGAAETSGTLSALEEECWNKRGLEALLGLEGQSARLFFAALGRSLNSLPETAWGFSGRNKNPPRDPVNSLLSFGYHLLGYHTATALAEVGLNPHLGLFHEPTYRFPALAADLQEEFRHLVDAFVWDKIHRKWVKPKDFQLAPGNAVYLKPVARRKVVEWFEERILMKITPPGASEPVTYRELMAQQALQIRELVQGRLPCYQPLRIEA